MINKTSIKFVFGFLSILLVSFAVVMVTSYLGANDDVGLEVNLVSDNSVVR